MSPRFYYAYNVLLKKYIITISSSFVCNCHTLLSKIILYDNIEWKQYYNVGTVQKYNRKIAKTGRNR